MFLLGLDIGSSSIKASLVDAATRTALKTVQFPEKELPIQSPKAGWAEQDPDVWWENCCLAIWHLLEQTGVAADQIRGIGIAYQMHGLVLLDAESKVLRPSIIWCDSRAVEIGHRAFQEIGATYCLEHYLNAPGNFTASKLKWVRDHEPEVFRSIRTVMLPGDYIAFKLTGEVTTTVSGLSEGIFWDFKSNELADRLLDYYGIDPSLLPRIVETFSIQGAVHQAAAKATGLAAGTPLAYRAGDQPNNALALNVLQPGEVAATGGTSGVVYGVVDQLTADAQQRVNSFAHVNHRREQPSIGVLLCINGAGIQYRWMRQQIAGEGVGYHAMEQMIKEIPVGAEGLRMLPFGNGAERMLGNRDLGSHLLGLQLNRHSRAHLFRAGLEGIAFSFVYGANMLKNMGLKVDVMRVGNDNLFQSAVFSNTIAHTLGCRIEVLQTTGAIGAAIASGFSIGIYPTLSEGLSGLQLEKTYAPEGDAGAYLSAYDQWETSLELILHQKE